jgi:hypothetical protein
MRHWGYSYHDNKPKIGWTDRCACLRGPSHVCEVLRICLFALALRLGKPTHDRVALFGDSLLCCVHLLTINLDDNKPIIGLTFGSPFARASPRNRLRGFLLVSSPALVSTGLEVPVALG